jgi:hypothetical protein
VQLATFSGRLFQPGALAMPLVALSTDSSCPQLATSCLAKAASLRMLYMPHTLHMRMLMHMHLAALTLAAAGLCVGISGWAGAVTARGVSPCTAWLVGTLGDSIVALGAGRRHAGIDSCRTGHVSQQPNQLRQQLVYIDSVYRICKSYLRCQMGPTGTPMIAVALCADTRFNWVDKHSVPLCFMAVCKPWACADHIA